MTGIIRFPRGSRPNKVTKLPMPPTRRAPNVTNGTGASSTPTNRQLAIEQALSEQRQQQQQQEQYGVAAAAATDSLSTEAVQTLIQDGTFYNASDQAHVGLKSDYGAEETGSVANDHDHSGSSNAKQDEAANDSDMLGLHGGSNGGDGDDIHNNGNAHGGDNGYAEDMVADMDEAEMSEMVGDAVDSYTEENGVSTRAAAQPGAANSHGLDMDLSAAAAAAAAAAAVASASHLATSGQGNATDHHLHAETSEYGPSAEPVTPTERPTSTTLRAQQSTADSAAVAAAAAAAAAAATPTETATAPSTTTLKEPHTTTPSTAEMARDSGYDHLPVESALAKRLAREPGLRPAQQRRPDQQLNLGRRSNVEALFAHIAGEEVAVPCKNCHKGHGPWTACVVVDGQMCGSCANCWFNASGARCSFHETKTPMQAHMHGHPPRQSLSGGVSASPSASAASMLDPQLAAAAAAVAGSYKIGSPISGSSIAAHVSHHFAAQQQQQHHHQHQQHQQHALSPLGASSAPSYSAAQQAAAAAVAAAVAVQQLSNDGNFPGGPAAVANGSSSTGSNGAVSNSNSTSSSPLDLHMVAALLGANRDIGDNSDAVAADPTPLVSLVINQALAEVRNADQRGRDLMLVEIAAKQLALAIVRYGEGAVAAASTVPDASSSAPAKDETSNHKDGAEAPIN